MKPLHMLLLTLQLAQHCRHAYSDSCAVLDNGHFENNTFLPGGCRLHHYTSKDMNQCLKKHHSVHGQRPLLAFIGDSRLRQRFRYLTSIVENKDYQFKRLQHDMFYPASNSQVFMEFRWRPRDSFQTYIDQWSDTYTDGMPLYAIVAVTLHYIQPRKPIISEQNQKEKLQEYRAVLDHALPKIASIHGTQFAWMLQNNGPSTYSQIIKDQINLYNEVTLRKLHQHNVTVWSSLLDVAEVYRDSPGRPDELHAGPQMLHWDCQVLLNLVCNKYLQPQDASCCKGIHRTPLAYAGSFLDVQRPVTDQLTHFINMRNIQYIYAVLFIISITAYTIIQTKSSASSRVRSLCNVDPENQGTDQTSAMESAKKSTGELPIFERSIVLCNVAAEKMDDSSQAPQWSMKSIIWLICKYGGILAYFYNCDRADVFDTEQKQYLPQYFCSTIMLMLFIGILSLKKSEKSDILNRQQTDEWKGWMQLVILAYHYTGTSQNLQIYMYIRVLVSSYLFMTGFGHVAHALKYKDMPLKQIAKRISEVLFRMNLLTVSLCVVMGKTYQFYYFVPLVSFCFISAMCVIWLPILILRYHKADSFCALYGSIFITSGSLFLLNSVLHDKEVMFNKIYSVPFVNYLFETEDENVQEWFFRWSIDRYSTLFGVFAGVALKLYAEVGAKEESEIIHKAKILLLVPLCSACIMSYLSAGELCTTKEDCNAIHAFTAVIPIVSYVVLRNICKKTREYHCRFFSWFGQISLELFISQYHIWLAADTKQLLVVIPGYPGLNLVVTTVTLVCVALHIKEITGKLTQLLLPK